MVKGVHTVMVKGVHVMMITSTLLTHANQVNVIVVRCWTLVQPSSAIVLLAFVAQMSLLVTLLVDVVM